MTEQIGSRVKQLLRTTVGRTDREVSEAIGMTPDAFSRSLNGSRSFSAAELARLAVELGSSTHWLITGDADPQAVSVAARHAYDFGTKSHETPDWELVEQQLSDVALAYQQVMDSIEETGLLESGATAEQIRSQLVEDHGPAFVTNFAEAVESTLGVDVIRMEGIDRAYSLLVGRARAIVVKQTTNWFYQNWSIAHELAHVVSGQLAPIEDKSTVEYRFESFANSFAADLLLPRQDLLAVDWKSMTPAAVASYIWDSGVSTNALRNRLNSLGISISNRVKSLLSLTTQNLLRQYWVFAKDSLDQISARMERASTRRFPSKLVAAHLGAVTAGALHAYTLAWMLGVDGAELEAELTPDSALVDIDILEFDLGLRGDSLS